MDLHNRLYPNRTTTNSTCCTYIYIYACIYIDIFTHTPICKCRAASLDPLVRDGGHREDKELRRVGSTVSIPRSYGKKTYKLAILIF